MKKTITLVLFLFLGLAIYAQASKDYTVAIKLSIQKSPLRYTLHWDKDNSATQYKVFSKALADQSWKELSTLAATDTFYTDSNRIAGQGVEYQVVKLTPNYNAYGYLYAADKLDTYNYRGKLLLLIDSTYKQPLATEINTLQADLRGDGWQIITRYVARTETPVQVKTHITDLWKQDSANFKSVYILGHVAVPYSGYVGPDGHTDHYGAWPADLYYADPSNSQWTDYVLNVKISSSPRNYNTPGDGKFDVDAIAAGSAKLDVGRVDMYDMPVFGLNDTELTRRYLNKAHGFKNNQYNIVLRGLIDDDIGGFGGEAFVRGGWSSYPGMFGDSIREADFRTELKARPYMFATTSGFGSYTSSSGIANTSDFVTDSFVSPFTSFFGSYFGDWDNTNNLLKAPLASSSLILTSTWSGRPVYYYHQMALGQTVGFCATASANSSRSLYHSEYLNNGVHMALMGDPTLRLHPISSATNLTIKATCDKITLKWTASTDTGISGYRIYRANALDAQYQWVATVATDSFEDKTALAGQYYYMVRAERLQQTPSGSYYNMALGITNSVSYYPAPKPAILVNNTLKCIGESFIIKSGTVATTAYTENWRIDGASKVFNDSLIFLPTQLKEYIISLAVNTPQGCYDSVSQKIIVGAVPNATMAITNDGLCVDSNKIYFTTNSVGKDYKYIWAISNGDTLGTQNPTKVFTVAGSYTVHLIIQDSVTGCLGKSAATSFSINPKLTTPVIAGTAIMKHRIPAIFTTTAQPNHTYTWSVSETPDFLQANNNTLNLRWDSGLLTATIKLVAREINGCKSDTAYFQVWTILNSTQKIDKNISVYPVPVSGGELFIANQNTFGGMGELIIFDAQGKEVLHTTQQINEGENRIDISTLREGTYYLHLKMGNSQSVHKVLVAGK